MDLIKKGHCTFDNLGTHAGGVSLTSLMGSQSTVVCHPQMVNHCPLILPLLPTPGTVGVACIMPKGIRIMDAHKPHDLRRLQGGHHPEES